LRTQKAKRLRAADDEAAGLLVHLALLSGEARAALDLVAWRVDCNDTNDHVVQFGELGQLGCSVVEMLDVIGCLSVMLNFKVDLARASDRCALRAVVLVRQLDAFLVVLRVCEAWNVPDLVTVALGVTDRRVGVLDVLLRLVLLLTRDDGGARLQRDVKIQRRPAAAASWTWAASTLAAVSREGGVGIR